MATRNIRCPQQSPDRPAGRLWLDVLHDWVTTVDHKKIGLMYIAYALIFLVIAGIEALLMRIQLAIPNNHFVSPQTFNRLFTMHGTTMVFFVGMPILFGFGNYLVPLMIGARDMAFPRLNAFSFWISAFGGLLLYFSYFGGERALRCRQRARRGLVCLRAAHRTALSRPATAPTTGRSSCCSAASAPSAPRLTLWPPTSMRCPGMKLSRMPLLVWLYLVIHAWSS